MLLDSSVIPGGEEAGLDRRAGRRSEEALGFRIQRKAEPARLAGGADADASPPALEPRLHVM